MEQTTTPVIELPPGWTSKPNFLVGFDFCDENGDIAMQHPVLSPSAVTFCWQIWSERLRLKNSPVEPPPVPAPIVPLDTFTSPHHYALHLIANWPDNYEEIACPQIVAFAQGLLESDDPDRLAVAVATAIEERKVNLIDNYDFEKVLEELTGQSFE